MNKQINQEEVWKIVKDFPNYEVSNRGNVRNIISAKVGYYQVTLQNKCGGVKFYNQNLVAQEFINNPNGFQYVGHIDRDILNNNAENLRWETKSQNCMKQRKKKGEATSIYKGVAYDIRDRKWMSYICKDYQRINLGRFDTELEAAQAYDIAAKVLFKEFARLNFKDDDDENIQSEKIKNFNFEEILQKEKRENSSIYRGVSLDKEYQKWQSYIYVGKRHIYLGQFDSQIEAAIVYDKAVKEIHGERAKLNFIDEEIIQSEKIKNFSIQAILQKGKRENSSIYRGVSFNKQSQKLAAYITVDKKKKYLGQFETEIEAAKVCDEAAKQFHGERAKLNFKDDEEQLTEQLANLNINEEKYQQ